MDFLNRTQPANNARQAAPVDAGGRKRDGVFSNQPRWVRWLFMVLLISGTAIVIAICCLMAFGGSRESRFVNDKQYQAVFLTNGQVYFGQVTSLTTKYVNLQDIYYLNSQSQTDTKTTTATSTSMSLVKLGCELHGPSDQMIINRDQVTFWENLSDSGKVTKAITEWKKANPKGQKCADTTSTTTQSTPAATTTKQ